MCKIEKRIIVGTFGFDTDIKIYTEDKFKKYISENFDIFGSDYADALSDILEIDIWESEPNLIEEKLNDPEIFKEVINSFINIDSNGEYIFAYSNCIIDEYDNEYVPLNIVEKMASAS